MTENEPELDRIASQRVLAWWDLDIQIGAFKKRKVTARPLREIERLLGHRLHVEGWDRYNVSPKGVWKLEAYNYLETPDPAWAAYVMLKRLNSISDWLQTSWIGFNWNATAVADDLDEATICAFYWKAPEISELQRYRSGGVLLRLVDPKEKAFDTRDRHSRKARPVVAVPPAPQNVGRYNVEFTVHIMCGKKQDVLSFHWPRFVEAMFPDGIQDFEIDFRTHLGRPNIIRVKLTLDDFYEHEAVAYCLAYASFFSIKLETEPAFRFRGERLPSQDYVDGFVAFEMTRD